MHHKQPWKRKKEHIAIRRVAVLPCSSLSAPRTVQTFKCGEVIRPVGDFGWQISNPNTFAFHFRFLGFLLHFLNFAYIYKISLVKIMKIFKISIYRALIDLSEKFSLNLLESYILWNVFWAKNTSLWDLSLMVWLHLITTYFPSCVHYSLSMIVIFDLFDSLCALFLVFMHLYDWGHHFI